MTRSLKKSSKLSVAEWASLHPRRANNSGCWLCSHPEAHAALVEFKSLPTQVSQKDQWLYLQQEMGAPSMNHSIIIRHFRDHSK